PRPPGTSLAPDPRPVGCLRGRGAGRPRPRHLRQSLPPRLHRSDVAGLEWWHCPEAGSSHLQRPPILGPLHPGGCPRGSRMFQPRHPRPLPPAGAACPGLLGCRFVVGEGVTPMTEAEWLTSTDPMKMLAFLGTRANKRRLRLFAVAGARDLLEHNPDPAARGDYGDPKAFSASILRAAAYAHRHGPLQ